MKKGKKKRFLGKCVTAGNQSSGEGRDGGREGGGEEEEKGKGEEDNGGGKEETTFTWTPKKSFGVKENISDGLQMRKRL